MLSPSLLLRRSAQSQQVEIAGLLYADELAAPEEAKLTLIFEMKQAELTLDAIMDDATDEPFDDE